MTISLKYYKLLLKIAQMKEEEQELLKGYRKLRPESKRLIMETVITAVSDEAWSPSESLAKRQYVFSAEGNQVLCDNFPPKNI